jgi:hypothetical protein
MISWVRKPRDASIATRPWVSSDSLHLRSSETLFSVFPKKLAGSKMLGKGWEIPGSSEASAAQRCVLGRVRPGSHYARCFSIAEVLRAETTKKDLVTVKCDGCCKNSILRAFAHFLGNELNESGMNQMKAERATNHQTEKQVRRVVWIP